MDESSEFVGLGGSVGGPFASLVDVGACGVSFSPFLFGSRSLSRWNAVTVVLEDFSVHPFDVTTSRVLFI